MRIVPIVGTAIEVVGRRRRIHRCTGAMDADLPERDFWLNVLFVEHDEPFPMHGHDYAELVVVLSGRGQHRTATEAHPIGAGEVLVIAGHQQHGFDHAETLRLCNVQFDPRQFLVAESELSAMASFPVLFGDRPAGAPALHLTSAQLAHVETLLRTMEEELRGRREGRRTLIRSALLMLLAALCRYHAAGTHASPTPVARMAAVLAHIRRHFREPLAVPALAAMAHMSESQFQRVFRRMYATTPLSLITRLRIEEACRLLGQENPPIAEVARASGFGTPAFFSTQFRRAMGQTPRAYRQALLHRVGLPGTGGAS